MQRFSTAFGSMMVWLCLCGIGTAQVQFEIENASTKVGPNKFSDGSQRFKIPSGTDTATVLLTLPAGTTLSSNDWTTGGVTTSHSTARFSVPLKKNVSQEFDVAVTYVDATTSNSFQPFKTRITLLNDHVGPALASGTITQIVKPGGAVVVTAKFADDDFDAAKANDAGNYVIAKGGNPVAPSQVYFNSMGAKVSFLFNSLDEGTYTLQLKSTFTDHLGNAGSTNAHEFTVNRGSRAARHVEYPRHVPDGEKSPGSFVTSRDVRLFYFRNAHRAAEIINRNVEQLNLKSVDEKRIRADRQREESERLTTERQLAERAAVAAAQTVRNINSQIRKNEQRLAQISGEITALETDAAADDSTTTTTTTTTPPAAGTAPSTTTTTTTAAAAASAPPAPPTSLGELQKQKTIIEQENADLRADLNVARKSQRDSEEALFKAETAEEYGHRHKFRLEVEAALEDRDTYVAGDINSVDPVTQVTISVIGEGVLQLRGPIRGINKIRRMIHQIDSPVGQVKVGVHTIQINGEHGDRMELVAEEIEKHIARSRFLTNQSGLMLRKAVTMVAGQIASALDPTANSEACDPAMLATMTAHPRYRDGQLPKQDMKYLYSFFGRDFIDQLRAMDSSLLHTDNKLLALNSMNTLSLSRAMYVAGLANNQVRQQILHTFQQLVFDDLAQREVDYYRTLTRTRHKCNLLNKLVTPRLQNRLDNKDAERIYYNAQRSYKFSNTVGFFDTHIAGAGTLNNMQYAVIRLAQAIQAQGVAQGKLEALVKQKSLLMTDVDRLNKTFEYRLLEQAIDHQEDKAVSLLEVLRSEAADVDNFLKRLAIALEDDVDSQFYQPAFQRIRRVSRTYDVQLGQIEKTTILTNNRMLAKVNPSATIEFDLPKRGLLLTEAVNGFRALADDHGNLLNDPTFLSGVSMLSGQPAASLSQNDSPMTAVSGQPTTGEAFRPFNSSLESLIPDPAVYKFETGTGFEIRPVIQPDGHSIVYDFNYMYTTNVREPIAADEKHLGRVKRHYVHTDVQTSSYELREISRYTVALKASRTSRGVPLMEDVPVVGVLFRPLASDESSLQQNIILANSVIYPTLFDLMGLRWTQHLDSMRTDNIRMSMAKLQHQQQNVESYLESFLSQRMANKTCPPVIYETPPQACPTMDGSKPCDRVKIQTAPVEPRPTAEQVEPGSQDEAAPAATEGEAATEYESGIISTVETPPFQSMISDTISQWDEVRVEPPVLSEPSSVNVPVESPAPAQVIQQQADPVRSSIQQISFESETAPALSDLERTPLRIVPHAAVNPSRTKPADSATTVQASASSVFAGFDMRLLIAYMLTWLTCAVLGVRFRNYSAASFVAAGAICMLAGIELAFLTTSTWQVVIAFVAIPVGIVFTQSAARHA